MGFDICAVSFLRCVVPRICCRPRRRIRPCLRHLDISVGEPIRLRLRCTRELADHWRMAALGTDQVILEESGKPFVEVDCQHTKALRAYILGLGAQVEVLGPEELRQWIGAQVASIAGNYPGLS